ncbi:APC amino acid permease [Gloeophyllum trabeum ATCC 11539]|uniref:APC amino acid permease n=1 Tax=Gloeophyllum trabeum (strain ATCC 11539 / FP-39264 / Madison 617) TaxID=670483 RepID=S7RD83_GLOTA|nr:APC amino acid permease [Gloeophyllum trabeum ATCC 11539]EPQ50384.1 APC amino acid permease [Gloeophyllum trabeum ATCC 11539]
MKKESSITVLEKPVDKNDDDALLESLGYKQEFKREFTPWELFGVLFSVLGPVPSFASVLVYAIPNGGPVAMVWGWAICAFFLVIIALAMADLASAAPTSGGLYYWTYSLSSPRWRYLLCWIGTSNANTMALTGSVASVGWGCAVQIMAAVSIGYDETFIPTNGQTYGVYCAILVVSGILCSTATKYIARVQSLYIVLNISCFIAIIIALPVATPEEFQNPASFALGNFQNLSTWHPGFAFVLSFIAPLWAVGAFDSPVHISEEASNASTAVPWAIILGASIPAILGWALNVVVAFCMGTDLESILGSGVGQPLAVIFLNSLGKSGALALWSVVIILQFMMGTSILTVASRQSFAFSRDGALPFSRFLYRIHPSTQTPVNCVWFVAFLAALLCLLSFAGAAAVGAVFTLNAAASYVAYCIPITARYVFENDFKPGPFSLGRWGFPVAATAVAWMTFSIIVFMFPTNPDPGPLDVNYTPVMLGALILGALGYYYVPVYGGKRWFRGPVVTLPMSDGDARSKSGEGEGEEKEA